jgi:hypothetical protein
VRRGHELFPDGPVEELQQGVIVAGDVQQAAGLAMEAQLRPGQHLAELLQGPVAARQRDEGVGQLRHQRLPFVHRAHHPQFGEPAVGQLARLQRRRDDPDHLAARRQRAVGGDPHQSNVAASVDQPQAPPGRQLAQPPRRLGVDRPRPRLEPQKRAIRRILMTS